jgi:hypothetical protein
MKHCLLFALTVLWLQSALGNFRVEPENGPIYQVQYKSAVELAATATRVAQSLMLSPTDAAAKISSVPKGGEIVAIIHATNIYAAMGTNFTVIVQDDQGRELLRTTGSDAIPEHGPRGWTSAIVVNLPQPIGNSTIVFVVNSKSGYREQFRIAHY